ncbi:hypothetical protein F3Y22_tig00110450pilonHSYRG00530 [Hibiscus syriacus]|uniref:Ubiquitin-like protease family profile domain-containing protein n=1 Tax=Hibiscus syriacus TaxID=106335 RepID=A0A6A3AK70_HIBSY|nr:hypothetical protein F3Y22_tig00110450pilonHSYRG00530 [Hibiscus syriacus]
MKSMGGKQPKGGYMYLYMAECKRMKEDGTHSGSVTKDVRSKWNSMSDAEKEPYITHRLGVQNNGKSVVEVCRSKNWKALASKYGLNQKVAHAEVEEDIKSGSYGGDDLKARVLLYLVGIFLCPTGDTSTNKDDMKLICDEGLKGEFNWAEYVHSRLIESIIIFQKGSQRYLKGLSAYERNGVAHIRAWGKEEVVRVMEKLKLDRPRKLEMRRQRKQRRQWRRKKRWFEGWMMVGGITVRETQQSRDEETLERHKGEVEGKIDVVVNEVEVLRELNMLTGGKIDVAVKEVVELRSELTGMKKVVEKNLDEEENEGRKDVTNIYTPESVIDADLDSECLAPQKKKQKVEKAVIPSGIEPVETAICDYLWNSGLESGYSIISMGNQYASVSDVATLKPSEWVGGVFIDLLAWTVYYDSKKSGRTIGYIPYHLAQQALDNVCIEGIVSFWGPMLHNYVKFTNCEKIMITINHNNSHWYLLVLDMVDRVATVYDSLFTYEAAKQRVNDAKRLIYNYNKKCIWVEAYGSLGNFPLQRFKFAEHKMNEQSNGHDCGIYVMMWMESIGSRGAICDFVVGEWDRMRILNDLHPHPKWLQNVSIRSGVFLKSLLNPPLPNPALLNHNLILKQSPLLRKSGRSKLTTLDPIRRKKDGKGVLNFKSTFTSWGWLEFLGLEPKYYPNLVRVFYNNASFEYEPNKIGWKRVKDVRLDLEREDNEDDQPMGDAMMEEAAEAPEAQVGQDVIITTVMEYMVNFREHIDSLVSGIRADISSLRVEVSMLRDELRQRYQTTVNEDDEEEDDDDDPNKYIVSATPLARKLVIFDVNGVLAYIPRHPEDVILINGLYEFMQFCLHNFFVAIWSSKMRHNMDRVLDKLRLLSNHFLFVWDQSKCKTEDKFTYCKDLNDVWNEFSDFNALNTLLVDDSSQKMIHNPINNYICPHSFEVASHSDDDALTKGGKIREYLEILLNAPNVLDFVSDNPFQSD